MNKQRHRGTQNPREPLFWLVSKNLRTQTFGSGSFHTHEAIKVLLPRGEDTEETVGWLGALAGSRPCPGHSQLTPKGWASEKKPQRKLLRWLSRQGPTKRKETVLNHLPSGIAIKQAGKKTALLIILFPQKKIMFSQLLSYKEAISAQPKRSEKKITPSAQVEAIIQQQQNFAGFCCFVVVANCLKCVICWHFWLVNLFRSLSEFKKLILWGPHHIMFFSVHKTISKCSKRKIETLISKIIEFEVIIF